jgi:hypothetical protein
LAPRALAVAVLLLGLGVVLAVGWRPTAPAPRSQGAGDSAAPRPVEAADVQHDELGPQDRVGPAEPPHRAALRVLDFQGAPVQHFRLSFLRVSLQSRQGYEPITDIPARDVRARDFATGSDFTPVAGLPAGTLVAVVEAELHVRTLSAPFTLGPGLEAPQVEVRLHRGGALEGTVLDPARKPVAGAAVQLEPAVYQPLAGVVGGAPPPELYTRASMRTDDGGRFRFDSLVHGSYDVRIEHPDWCAGTVEKLAVRDDATTAAGAVVLRIGAIVEGTVVTETGEPVAGIRITFEEPRSWRGRRGTGVSTMPGGTVVSATSRADGTYRLPVCLPPGVFEAYAWRTILLDERRVTRRRLETCKISPGSDRVRFDLRLRD